MKKIPDTSFDPVRRQLLLAGAAGVAVVGASFLGWRRFGMQPALAADAAPTRHFEVTHTDAEWRALLTPDQYAVLRQQGTERAFTSPLDHEKRNGTFSCAGCGNALYSSETKFDSGTGWPSFYRPLPNAIGQDDDTMFGMLRTEVHCRRCGGHLGHVFDDGPPPTGLRYCMNGVALTFKAEA
jgi:peptide-methionine (R)-S-oxide reductase